MKNTILILLACATAFASIAATAQTGNKVVVIPLGGDGESIMYTGVAPITVDNEAGTISFDVSQLPVIPLTSVPTIPNSKLTNDNVSQPSLTVNCQVALTGIFPSRNFEPWIGQILWVGYNFAQRGFALCDGQLLQIAQNTALFSLYGTTYGGDGRTTFALPDMRGRTAVHQGSGPGLTPRQIGSKFGAEVLH